MRGKDVKNPVPFAQCGWRALRNVLHIAAPKGLRERRKQQGSPPRRWRRACEPLVLGPLLDIARTPLPTCLILRTGRGQLVDTRRRGHVR